MEARIHFWQESHASGFWTVWGTEIEQTSFQGSIFFFNKNNALFYILTGLYRKSWKIQINAFGLKKMEYTLITRLVYFWQLSNIYPSELSSHQK